MPYPRFISKAIFFGVILMLTCGGCGSGSTQEAIVPPGTLTPPFSLVQSPTTVAPNDDAINVKQPPFNALGDGVSDDTLAIQAAIDSACSAGGGEVYFPSGTYIISPRHQSDQGALTIHCDDIALLGDGMNKSVLSRETIGNSDPDTTCPINGDTVNRGAGVYVTAKKTGDRVRHSVHLQQLSLFGNRKMFTGMSGSNQWPATVTNCFDVWDISDKGFYVQQDHDSSDIVVDQVEIAYFSGELIYGGSLHSTAWKITNSNLHHSNGDAISISAGLTAIGNTLHDLGTNGIENQPYGTSEPQAVISNIVFNTQLDGIGIVIYNKNIYNTDPPAIEVAQNYIQNARRFGIVMLSKGGSVHHNRIYDSGVNQWTGCGIGLIGVLADGSYQIPRNITLNNNTVEAHSVNTQCGVQIYSPPAAPIPASSITIRSNSIGPLQGSSEHPSHIGIGLSIAPGSTDTMLMSNDLW